MNDVVLIITVLVIILGIAGTILPMIPGIPLVFLAILVYGWMEGFNVISGNYLLIIGILTLLSIVFSYLSTVMGAKYFGSGRLGLWGALIGTFAGLLLLPPIGLLIGPFAGAFIGEYISVKDTEKAIKAAFGSLLGLFTGVVFNLAIGIYMLVTFLMNVY
ncbi:MAG: DUF456 domain-containing protein [Syntrophomonadaceae bacterium]|nr:DUF456 domain-containing protein [Syntrophomonadaceae bacterium]